MDATEDSTMGLIPVEHHSLAELRASSQASEDKGQSGDTLTPEIHQDFIGEPASQALRRDSSVDVQFKELDEEFDDPMKDYAPYSPDVASQDGQVSKSDQTRVKELDEEFDDPMKDYAPYSPDVASQDDQVPKSDQTRVTITENALGGWTTVHRSSSCPLKFEDPEDFVFRGNEPQKFLQERRSEEPKTDSHSWQNFSQSPPKLCTASLAPGIVRSKTHVSSDSPRSQIRDHSTISEATDVNATDVEESLFVPSAHSLPCNSSPSKRPRPRSVPKKQRRKPARTAAEALRRRHRDIAEKQNKTDKRNQGVIKNIMSRQSLSKARKSSRRSRNDPNLFQKLAHNDVFAAHEDGPDNSEASVATAPTKIAHIDQLLSTCSKYDMHKCIISKQKLLQVTREFGLNKVKPAAKGRGHWDLSGIKVSLYPHQLIGVHWMLQREFSLPGNGPLGGICADVMGLGKTVEILSVAVHNPGGPTLVVMPAGILDQWETEIARLLEGNFGQRVMRYKRSHNHPKFIYEECDFVLTSYNELRMSCVPIDGDTKKYLDKLLRTQPTAYEDYIEEKIRLCGILHQISWHRVVLDEGHIIKNHKSTTSLAANALKGKHRWILSGTPIMNNLGEFYAHLRFLKVPDLPHYHMFCAIFCGDDDKQCQLNMGLLLADVMIRRTHNDKMFGKPLVSLPKPRRSHKNMDLMPEEKILYRNVEGRFRQILNKQLAKGDKAKNLTYWIVQLTRLRQLTAHPLLIEREIKIMFTKQQLLNIREIVRSIGDLLYKRIDIWIKEKDESETLEELDRRAVENAIICQECGQEAEKPHQPRAARCQDTFCKSCIERIAQKQIAEGLEEPRCPICNATFDVERLKPMRSTKENYGKTANSPSPSKNKKGKDWMGTSLTTPPSAWLKAWDDEEVPMLQSAKVDGVLAQVMDWLQEEPDDKIIIFTQWRALAGMLGRRLKELKVNFLYYTGNMSLEKRAIATQEFENQPEIEVLVSGLKCGSLGLNWTFACKVINVDLWWNTCVEDQAFGRVYRIGQQRESYLSRVVTLDTVDSRILKLQEKKNRMIEGAMKDKVTHEELLGLFGRTTTDSTGQTVIVPDYSDDPDWNDADLDFGDEDAQDLEKAWENRGI